MIPKFPDFCLINESDLIVIEKFVNRFAPYSDFNSVSLYSWSDHSTEISWLNNNLVIRIRDYTSDAFILSVLGNTNLDSTVSDLMGYADKSHSMSVRLLGQEIYSALSDEMKKKLVEDRDHFDYVIDCDSFLHDSKGPRFQERRRRIRAFSKSYPNVSQHIYEKVPENIRSQILEVAAKSEDFEEIATRRVLALNRSDILTLTTIDSGKLIGYSIMQLLDNSYAIGHFQSYDKSYKYHGEVIVESVVKLAFDQEKNLINIEQDLGIPGLRSFKKSLSGENFLKKYRVL